MTETQPCESNAKAGPPIIEPRLAVMGSNPNTGECIAAFAQSLPWREYRELMRVGTLFERRTLDEVNAALLGINPAHYIAFSGPSIGTYLDGAIPDWQEMVDGSRYRFIGVWGNQTNFDRLAVGQIMLSPGLIYQLEEPNDRPA